MVVYIYGAQRGNPDMGHVEIPLTRLPSHQYDAATYKFTGKERDAATGLDNFIARYDSSSLGRFMSPDPANYGAIDESPQTWNAYSYVANNPLNATDPDGLDCVYTQGFSQTGEVTVEADGPDVKCGDEWGCPTRRVYVWGF